MNEEEIVLKRLKDTLDVLIGKNVITNLDFQIRNMVEDCIKVIQKLQKELEQEKEKNERIKDGALIVGRRNGKSQELNVILEEYISKDKIRAKIEELKQGRKVKINDLDGKQKENTIIDIDKIEVLEELLEE